jgi:hypothetical protein
VVACHITCREATPGRDSVITVAGDRSIVRIAGGSWPRYRVKWLDLADSPVGAAKARIWGWTAGLNGTAWFDDLEVWVI